MFGYNSDNLQHVLERWRIRELVEYERYCRDYGLWENMKELYSKDSWVKISWYDGTGYGFIESSKNMKGGYHKIHNTLIEVNGHRAVAEILTEIQSQDYIKGTVINLFSEVRLLYRLICNEDKWEIISVNCIYEKDSITPAIPTPSFFIEQSELEEFRSSYQCLCYILNKKGLHINDNLPGIDYPEMVEELYCKCKEWLNS